MKRPFLKKAAQNTLLILFGLVLCFLFIEVLFTAAGIGITFYRKGFSHPLLQPGQNTYRILCLGESTTARGYPKYLEQQLNQTDSPLKVQVTNAGISGTNTTSIVNNLERNLKQYHPDMVVTMMGINDSSETLVYWDNWRTKAKLFLASFKTVKIFNLLRSRWLERRLAKSMGYIDQAENYSREAQTVKAKELYLKALETDPKNYYAYGHLIKFYRTQGDFETAEKIYGSALANVDMQDYQVHDHILNHGYDALVKGRDQVVERALKATLSVNPQNDLAYTSLGILLQRRGQFKMGEELLKKAMKINPYNGNAFNVLVNYYFNTEQYDSALEFYKKILKIAPDSERIHGALANIYQRKGDFSLAEYHEKKAQEILAKSFQPATYTNYRKLRDIVLENKIKLVVVQYPMRNVEDVKRMLDYDSRIVFVDNEVFREQLETYRYDDLFTDRFGGNFGHFTSLERTILVRNIAKSIRPLIEKQLEESK